MTDGSTPAPRRLVVLISGRGSNLEALAHACEQGRIAGHIVGVISNRPEARGLEFARARGIPTRVVDHREYGSREAFDAELTQAIEAYKPDFVILAGFMRILTPALVQHFAGRLVNIHPSLLPNYRGLHTHARALADGATEHGASVHFVTPELDGGPVIMQARVPVRAGDNPESLAARVQRAEHRLYPEVVRRLCAGEIRWDRRVLCADGTPLEAPLELDEDVHDAPDPDDRSAPRPTG